MEPEEWVDDAAPVAVVQPKAPSPAPVAASAPAPAQQVRRGRKRIVFEANERTNGRTSSPFDSLHQHPRLPLVSSLFSPLPTLATTPAAEKTM